MYDWANSAYITVIVAAVFPIWFSKVAARDLPEAVATQRFGWSTAVALAIAAVMGPILGALADVAPIKKRLLAVFMGIGVVGTAALALLEPGDWLTAAVLFGITNIAATSSFVFYDSLLPHIARPDEVDRVSTAGYALGYLGGAILLAVDLVLIQKPELFGLDGASATRVAFVSVALWWLLFSIPLFRRVREPAIGDARLGGAALIRRSFGGLAATFRELRRYRQALVFLAAFLIYNDGIGTIIRMATIYGTELGLPQGSLILALMITQVVGIPATFVFGAAAGRIGTKPAIYLGLVAYCAVSVLGYFMTSAVHFYALAGLVGLVQGGTQALSRSLFASMIPAEKSSEFFGLFGAFEKFAGILGPAVFAGINAATGSSRGAILSIIVFFVVGGLLLTRVDVAEGRRAAREAGALRP
jgi:UMF1 family MFS transporter